MIRAVILMFILLSLLSAGGVYAEENQRLINKIVAIVGDEVLTLYELEELASPLYETYLSKVTSAEEKERVKARIRREVLEQWIEDTLIGLEVKRFGIRVTDEELEEFLRHDARQLEGSLSLSNEEREKLKEKLSKIKFVQMMVRDKIAIPEEELKKAYEEKVKKLQGVTTYQLEVLILKKDAQVGEIHRTLLSGKNFEEVAKENPTTTLYLKETFKEEELDKEVLESIKTLNAGEISSPIERGETIQIVKVLKKETTTPPAFEELRKGLYEELFQRRAQEYLERWIKELKESKLIKIYL